MSDGDSVFDAGGWNFLKPRTMKNTMKFLTVVCIVMCCGTFAASAQIFVTIRPQRQVVVRSAPPQAEYVWVDEDWEWRNGQYVWVGGHWIEPRPQQVYRPGRWTRSSHGHTWQAGRWEGNRGMAVPRGKVHGNGHGNGHGGGHKNHR